MSSVAHLPRRALLALLLVGVVGTLTELLLLEHWEGWQQWVPLALLGAAVPLTALAIWRPAFSGMTVFRGWMGVFVLSGLLGVWLHYSGNVEFELEMVPDVSGWTLFKEAATGATPALAPGTLVWFGVLGLLAGWRAPSPS